MCRGDAAIAPVSSWLKKFDGKFVTRGDIRLDYSTHDVFLADNPQRLVRHQFTTAVNLIYLF